MIIVGKVIQAFNHTLSQSSENSVNIYMHISDKYTTKKCHKSNIYTLDKKIINKRMILKMN